MKPSALEQEWHKAMLDIYRMAKKDCQYNATRFLEMITDLGGLEAARRLINANTPSDGFTALWEHKRLDLTVEAHALMPRFSSLFDQGELEMARKRLVDYGYEFDG